jgi:hypothetical protein
MVGPVTLSLSAAMPCLETAKCQHMHHRNGSSQKRVTQIKGCGAPLDRTFAVRVPIFMRSDEVHFACKSVRYSSLGETPARGVPMFQYV